VNILECLLFQHSGKLSDARNLFLFCLLGVKNLTVGKKCFNRRDAESTQKKIGGVGRWGLGAVGSMGMNKY
jgi:hypothetical protein